MNRALAPAVELVDSWVKRAVVILIAAGIVAVVLWRGPEWGDAWLPAVPLVLITVEGVNVWIGAPKESTRREVGQAIFISGLFAVTLWGVDRLQRDFEARQAAKQQAFEHRQSLRLTIGLRRNLTGIDLHKENLSRFQLAGKNLAGANLANANLTRANFQGTNLSGADLTGAHLKLAQLQEANLDGANLAGAHLRYADLTRATAADANFSDARIQFAVLEGTDMPGACLTKANLHRAALPGADLTSAVLTKATLTGTVFESDLRPATLAGAGFAGVSAQGSVWPGGSPPSERIEPDASKIEVPDVPVPTAAKPDKVIEVEDGDTVELQRIGAGRLIGVDAPDLNAAGGRSSRAFAVRKLYGTRVEVMPGTEGRDTFDRRLIYVWTPDGQSFNEALLETGHATLLGTDPFVADEFQKAEQKAKQLGIGYWRECPADED